MYRICAIGYPNIAQMARERALLKKALSQASQNSLQGDEAPPTLRDFDHGLLSLLEKGSR